jgi:hypothetical protein
MHPLHQNDCQSTQPKVTKIFETFFQVFSNISGFVVPMDAQKLKEDMKDHIDVLLQDFFEDADLIKILPGVALQVELDLPANYCIYRGQYYNNFTGDFCQFLAKKVFFLK